MLSLVTNLCNLFNTFNFDAGSLGAGLGIQARMNTASQEFTLRQAEINFKIDRQSLHRQDLRDLVGVTTGRMDIFLLVGTLLLTFCITWYSGLTSGSGQPEWFQALFLIHNFCAVGYLVFCVWLAMHASIASSAVGVRLLTGWARLSIPRWEDLQSLKVPLFPVMDKAQELGAQLQQRFMGSSASAAPVAVATDSASSVLPPGSSGAVTAVDMLSSAMAQTKMKPLPEDPDHLRRYLEEQKRWISYDAHSRLCMSLGMNQMLQALSYHIVGTVIDKSRPAAVFCFFGVKILGGLLLKLDTRDEVHTWKLNATVVFFFLLPGVFAGLALWIFKDRWWQSYVALPSFILHACFLARIGLEIQPKSTDSGNVSLPMQMRTVHYINIIDPDHNRTASVVSSDLRNIIRNLRTARTELAIAVDHVMEDEVRKGCHSDRNGNEKLRALNRTVADRSELLQNYYDVSDNKMARQEVELAQQSLDRYELWTRAPEVLETLNAMRSKEVTSKLKPEQREALERSYEAFLKHSQDFKLGLGSADENSPEDAHNMSSLSQVTASLRARSDGTARESSNSGPSSNGLRSVLLSEDPQSQQMEMETYVGSFHTGRVAYKRDALSEWEGNLSRLTERSSNMAHTATDDAQAEVEVGKPTHNQYYVPPDKVPGKVVRYFTLGVAWWWVLSAVWHAAVPLKNRLKASPPLVELSSVNTTWPQPESLFEVASLHCQGSDTLFLRDQFTFFATSARHDGSLGVEEMSDVSGPTLLCRQGHCETLSPAGTDVWKLEPLSQTTASSTPVGSKVSAVWGCSLAEMCETIWVSHWDGSDVVVLKLMLNQMGRWRVRRQSRLPVSCAGCPHERYGDVSALQLGSNGKSLAVLFDNGARLDGWDTVSGQLLGRWRFETAHSSMCHDGHRLFAVRRGKFSPVLEVALLPGSLVDHVHTTVSPVRPIRMEA